MSTQRSTRLWLAFLAGLAGQTAAIFDAVAEAAGRDRSDVASSITAICEAECEELATRLEQVADVSAHIAPLPDSDRSVLRIRGRAPLPEAVTVNDLTGGWRPQDVAPPDTFVAVLPLLADPGVQILNGPSTLLFGTPCRSAQAEAYGSAQLAELAPGANLEDALLTLTGGAWDPRRQTVHVGPLSTPESFLAGDELAWGPLDSLSPAGFYRDDTVTQLAAGNDGFVYYEEIDDCERIVIELGPTRTFVAGTTTRPGDDDDEDEDPELPIPRPPDDPVPTPEDDEDDEEACCGFVAVAGGEEEGLEALLGLAVDEQLIAYPYTTEYLSQESESVPQPARHDVAWGAHRVMLQSGSMLYPEDPDVMVTRLGIDFLFQRTYAGDMVTDEGGLMGQRWDFSFNKRIVPQPDVPVERGRYVEPVNARTPLRYSDGRGRSELYTFKSYDRRIVRNFGYGPGPGGAVQWPTFVAHVTTYESPPGAFHEIQRYVLENPADHPFKRHPDVKADELGEAIFYVLRTREHMQYVFNCRGQLIYVFDEHRNFLELWYDDEKLNPLTHNPMLATIWDTQRQRYEIGHTVTGHGSYTTSHDCRVKSASQAPIFAIDTITDPWGRVADFRYDSEARLVGVQWRKGQHTQTISYGYTASGGREHLLNRVVNPEDQASGVAFLENYYSNGRVSRQVFGDDSTTLRYEGTATVVTDPLGTAIRFTLERKPGGYVIAAKEVVGSEAVGGGTYLTRIEHNDATQVTRVERPRGNDVSFAYDGGNEPVAVAESPIRNFAGPAPAGAMGSAALSTVITTGGAGSGVNYRNDLSRGNLLSITFSAGRADAGAAPASLTRSFTYEPLYNAVAGHTDPKGQTDEFDFSYEPGFEGQWRERRFPDARTADGDRLTGIVTGRSFDRTGSLTSFTDPAGEVTRYQPHATGLPVQIDFPAGPAYTMARDARGNVVLDEPPGGPAVRIDYDLRDLPVASVLDPDGLAVLTEYTYDANTNLVSEIRRVEDLIPENAEKQPLPQTNQINHVYRYDRLNRPVQERVVFQNTDGSVTDLTTERQYDGNGNVVWSRTPAPGQGSVEVNMRYNAMGRLTRLAVGDQVRRQDYDANGNLAAEHDPSGLVKRYVYDGFDRLVRIEDAAGGEHRLTRDDNGNVTEQRFVGRTDLNDPETQTLRLVSHGYDSHDRRIETAIHSLGGGYGWVRHQYVYDAGGRLAAQIDPRGGRTSIEHDALGRPVRRTDPAGNELELRYSGGRLAQMIEHEAESVYDADTQRFVDDRGVYVTNLDYDRLGNLRSRNHEGRASRYFHDSRGLVRLMEDAGGSWSRAAYDGMGRLTRMERLGRTTRFRYGGSSLPIAVDNGLSREERTYTATGQVATIAGTTGTVANEYDPAGLLQTMTDARGRTTRFSYDALGRVSEAASGRRMSRFQRDGLGRVVRAENGPVDSVALERDYDGLGKLVSETQIVGGDRQTTTVRWQAGLRGYRIQYPDGAGGTTTAVALDELGRVVRTGGGYGRNIYRYSGSSRLAGRELSAEAARSITAYDYDRQRRPVGIRHVDGEGRLVSSRARYGPHGLRWLEEHLNPDERTGLPSIRRLVTNHFDRRGRIAQRIAYESRRRTPDHRWLHTYSHTRNVYDDYNRLNQVATYNVAERNRYILLDVFEGRDARIDELRYDDEHPELVGGVTTRVKVAPFDIPGGTSAAAWVPWIGRNNEELPDEYDEPPGTLDVSSLETLAGDCGEQSYCQTTTLERDANGNLISDGLFRFEYDHNNRLVRAEDLYAEDFQRTLIGRYVYGPLGRLTARRFELHNRFSSDPAGVYQAFDLKNLRWLYHDDDLVAELVEPYGGGELAGSGLLARYVPHATHGSPAQMVRRLDDDLERPMRRFDLHYGLAGNVAYVTEDRQLADEPFKRVDSIRYYNGVDAWQLSRNEHFVADSTTRVPYVAAGQRHDSFLDMGYAEGGSSFTYDYRNARLVQLARYGRENWSQIRERIIEMHPKPAAVRQMEYAMAGVTAVAAAPVLATVGPMVYSGYAAAGAYLGGASGMAMGAGTDVAVQVGVAHLLGQDIGTDQLLMSAAIGGLTGGLGHTAGSLVARRVTQAGRAVRLGASLGASVGMDTLSATALEVGLTGADFTETLFMNAVVGTVGTGIGVANGSLLLSPPGTASGFARAPEGVAPAASNAMQAQRPRVRLYAPPPRRQAAPTRSRNPQAAQSRPAMGEPLLAKPTDIDQVRNLLRQVNPGYGRDPLRHNNCMRCTNRTSMLLRGGYSVAELRAGRGMPPLGQMAIDTRRALSHLDPVVRRGWIQTMDFQFIESVLEGAGPYAHGRIWGARNNAPGHVWNVWYDGKTVWMVDGQTNTVARGSQALELFYGQGYTDWKFLLESF